MTTGDVFGVRVQRFGLFVYGFGFPVYRQQLCAKVCVVETIIMLRNCLKVGLVPGPKTRTIMARSSGPGV